MILWKVLVCLVIICTQIGNIKGQCQSTECSSGYFDSDLVLDPDQACYADGTDVSVSCPGNFGGFPGPYTCSNGAFNFPSGSCEVWTCAQPNLDAGIIVNPDQETYNARETVTFSCQPGYQIFGATGASCDSQDTWNPDTFPTCQQICDPNPNINNGNLTSVGPFTDESTATVSCYPGYDLGGGDSSNIQCVDGSWDKVPSCYSRCNVPGVPNSDEPTAMELRHQSTLTIVCDEGHSYEQQTEFGLSCNDGVLTGTVPDSCYQDCDPLPDPQDGSTSGGHLHGETTYYSCNRGFRLNETMSETCNDGVWSMNGSTPTCYDLSLENSISLICNPSHYIVEVPKGLFDSETVGLNSVVLGNDCYGDYDDEEYIFVNSTYNECGTTLTVDSTNRKLIYENLLTNHDEGQVTTDSALRVYIHCVFNQQNLVSSSAVIQDTLTRELLSDSKYSLSFGVYADMNYMMPVTGSDVIDTNSDIFLKAQVNNVLELDVYPSTCYATPTADSKDPLTYTLIQQGVSQTEEFASDLSDEDVDGKPTFSFRSKAFRFSGHENQLIYIHCELKICKDNTCPLPGGGGRRRRSVSDTQLVVTKHVFAGPIKTRQRREAEVVSPMRPTALIIYTATLSVVFAVCIIGFAGTLFYRRHRYKGYERL